MKYSIGDIVNYFEDRDNTYIVLATSIQPLTNEYLELIKSSRDIARLMDMAKIGVRVDNGFDYKIVKLLNFKKGVSISSNAFINVFEEDVER